MTEPIPGNIPFPEWRVSPQRAVTLSGDGTLPCVCSDGMFLGAPAWPAKASADNLDYAIDGTTWLQNSNDSLASVSASVDPDGPTVGWQTIMRDPTSGRTYAVVWIGGGIPGELYSVKVDIFTAGGRSISVVVALPVTSLSPAQSPLAVPTLPDGTGIAPNAIQLPDTSILTLGPSVISLVSVQRLLTVDGTKHLTAPNGRALLDAIYASHTDTLLIA